ncbi:hypothetical protein Tco_1352313 [Tanacetum coccineum]
MISMVVQGDNVVELNECAYYLLEPFRVTDFAVFGRYGCYSDEGMGDVISLTSLMADHIRGLITTLMRNATRCPTINEGPDYIRDDDVGRMASHAGTVSKHVMDDWEVDRYGNANLVIMEYLVNISKRRAFWSLNEDILKITILKTNTPYPLRKIWRIRACTHQRPQRNKAQYAVSRRCQYAVLEIWNEYNILEDVKRGPYSKKSPIRVTNPWIRRIKPTSRQYK